MVYFNIEGEVVGWFSCLQRRGVDFSRQACECPEAKGIRAVEEKGEIKNLACRMSALRAIKNIPRDECNRVYLAAEKECYATPYLFGHCRSSNKAGEKRDEKERRNKMKCSSVAGESKRHRL